MIWSRENDFLLMYQILEEYTYKERKALFEIFLVVNDI